MKKTGHAKISIQRDQLDRRLQRLKSQNSASPKQGWIRAVRESLGMSATQLASRLGITRQSFHRLEKNELSGAITLETLRKIADALSCDLNIALVPRTSLHSVIEARAREVAEKIIARTALHMDLEKQGTDSTFQKRRIKELADELVRTGDRRLWEEF